MARSRFYSRLLLLAPFLSLSLAVACSSASPEQQILINFFRAARLRDNTTLANISAVSFDTRTEGSVQEFEIASIGPEQRRTLQIKQLADEADKVKAEDEDLSKRKKAYQDENLATLQRVVKAQRAGESSKGKDAEVLAAWTKWSQDETLSKRRVSQARTKLAAERGVAVSSLTPPGRPDVDVSNMNVEVITKRVTVNAQVRTPDGQMVPKTFVFTMQRAVGSEGNQTHEGRWIIADLEHPQSGAKTS